MPEQSKESTTLPVTPIVVPQNETKNSLLNTTHTQLSPTQLYIEGTVVTSDSQLAFKEYKVQLLISKQIDLEYGVTNVFTMLTIILALGGLIAALATNQVPLMKWSTIVILLACFGFGVYGHYKQSNDASNINRHITQSINAIDLYKCNKEKRNFLPNKQSQNENENLK